MGVYVWRGAELETTRARLMRSTHDQEYAAITAERLEGKLRTLRTRMRRVQTAAAKLRSRPPETIVSPAVSTEPDGRYFGFIEGIDLATEPPVLIIDFAEFLTGDAAEEAATKAGAEVLDYHISNVNPKLRTLAIALDARVRWLTDLPEVGRTTLQALEKTFSSRGSRATQRRWSPWWITIEDTTIVKIEEQYLP